MIKGVTEQRPRGTDGAAAALGPMSGAGSRSHRRAGSFKKKGKKHKNNIKI